MYRAKVSTLSANMVSCKANVQEGFEQAPFKSVQKQRQPSYKVKLIHWELVYGISVPNSSSSTDYFFNECFFLFYFPPPPPAPKCSYTILEPRVVILIPMIVYFLSVRLFLNCPNVPFDFSVDVDFLNFNDIFKGPILNYVCIFLCYLLIYRLMSSKPKKQFPYMKASVPL